MTGAAVTDVVIRGERLLLRGFRADEIDTEWEAMLAANPASTPRPPREARFRARLARSGTLQDGWLDLAIDLAGISIGRIQTFVPPGRVIPPGTFEVGIVLRENIRGQGYGREALVLLTGWLFEHAQALAVEGATDPANHAMQAVFGHAGWQQAGTVTEHDRDWSLYRITRGEWQAVR
jgi:RimJ/RimL family protein N-acetyltransferase